MLPSKLRREALNWQPPYPEAEDEASMKRHKNEWQRRNPDKRKIEQGMILTFPDRRRLMNQQVPIAEVMGEYPSLFDFCQVWCLSFKVALYSFFGARGIGTNGASARVFKGKVETKINMAARLLSRVAFHLPLSFLSRTSVYQKKA